MKTLLLAAFTFTATSAFAGEKQTVECSKFGRNGQPEYAKVEIEFDIAKDGRNGLRTIYDLRGEIRASGSEEDLVSDNAYIGIFDTKSLKENPDYNPVRYKNSSQFQKLNAKETRGAESGMWGSLIVPKNMRGTFESHYIFQAGDHMGGTIHMSCKVKR